MLMRLLTLWRRWRNQRKALFIGPSPNIALDLTHKAGKR